MPTRGAASGLERAVFGDVARDGVDAWLDRHLGSRLSSGLDRVLFRAGRVGAVHGVRLTDEREVVVKVRCGAVPDPGPLTAAVRCQRHVAAHGYPCPVPLDGPATTAGLTAVVESLLDIGAPDDVRDPGVRGLLAQSLVDQAGCCARCPTSCSR